MVVSLTIDKFFISIDKTDKMVLLGRIDDEFIEFKLWRLLDACGSDLVRKFDKNCYMSSNAFMNEFLLIIKKNFKDNVYIYML